MYVFTIHFNCVHIVNIRMSNYSASSSIAPLPHLKCGQNARVDDLNNRIYSRALAPHIAPTFAPIYDISPTATRYNVFPTSSVPVETLNYDLTSKPISAHNNQIEHQLHRTALYGKDNVLAFVPQSASDLYRDYIPAPVEYKEFSSTSFPLLAGGEQFAPNARMVLQQPNSGLTFNISTKSILRNS